jgi:hypothetical protein
LGVCVPDVLHQLLGGVVLLGGFCYLVLLGREPHAWQVLQEGLRVEVGEVAQVASELLSLPVAPEPKTDWLVRPSFLPLFTRVRRRGFCEVRGGLQEMASCSCGGKAFPAKLFRREEGGAAVCVFWSL